MNPKRRVVVAWSLMQLAVLGSGCSSAPKVTRRTYTEKVSTLLMSHDKKRLVILGERYHYVFDAPPDIVALLASPLKARASARIQPFHVDLDGGTAGRYSLLLPDTLSEDEARQAQAMGFARDPQGAGWQLDNQLEGRRFIQGNTVRAGRTKETLSHQYEVSVEAEETRGEKAAQDLASPIAVTADGMLMVYLAVLVPILIPLYFLAREKRPALIDPPASAASAASAAS